jgi:anti-sigma factor RsiW
MCRGARAWRDKEEKWKCEMKCEEFEEMGLDAERDASLSEVERAAAREHASTCPRCASLQDSWQAARVELHAFAEATAAAESPARVEMRLRQEFRTQHRTMKTRRTAVIAAWALATAAVLIGAVSWINWRKSQMEEAVRQLNAPQNSVARAVNNGGEEGNNVNGMREPSAPQQQSSANNESADTLVADNELSNFTLLPGVLPADADDTEIVRVRMQRGALGALGLPVNEERAGEWIQVDLLVGDDGLPQAVRLPQ